MSSTKTVNALEQAEALRQEAISLLLIEKKQIEIRLSQLGYDGQQKATSGKRRGRPPAVMKSGELFPNENSLSTSI